ncbi:MAG: hypothetical protein LBM00_09320 [Deltaproteobacteria bacterium]|jgi:hypothetical protein|nr:hypothetical protein [Deltaproteobacteria bacterium]
MSGLLARVELLQCKRCAFTATGVVQGAAVFAERALRQVRFSRQCVVAQGNFLPGLSSSIPMPVPAGVEAPMPGLAEFFKDFKHGMLLFGYIQN